MRVYQVWDNMNDAWAAPRIEAENNDSAIKVAIEQLESIYDLSRQEDAEQHFTLCEHIVDFHVPIKCED